jgi:hypothetical protein
MARRKPEVDTDKIDAIAERIKPVTEDSPFVKLGVYGRNGSGKTRLSGSAPNTLIVDVNEEGTRSVRHTGAHVLECNSYEDVGYAYWLLHNARRVKGGGLAVPIRGGKKVRIEVVTLDTVTALNKAAMRLVMGEAEERDPNRPPSMPDKRSYGRAGELVSSLVLMFRNLPLHVVFVAQERTITDEDTGEVVLHTMDLPAGSRGTVLGACGIVGHISPQQVKRRVNGKVRKVWEDRLLVGPSEEFDTKDRTNALGEVVRNPTLPQIIQVWRDNPPDDDEED